MLTKDTLLTFNVLSTQHLLNEQMVFFNKNVSRVLLLYKYSTEHSITTQPQCFSLTSAIPTYFTHYGSHRIVVTFDLPTQNIAAIHFTSFIHFDVVL